MPTIEEVLRDAADRQLSVTPYVHSKDPQGEAECPPYTLTRFELRLLARHWAHVVLDHDIFVFVTGQFGWGPARDRYYAEGRLEEIAGVLGQDVVDEAVAEVRAVLRERWGDHIWGCFEKNDRENLGPVLPWDQEPEGSGPAASPPQ